MSEQTSGYCWQHHKFTSLAGDCPGCADEEERRERSRECPICTQTIVPDVDDQFDCDNCGAHLEPL